MLNKIKILLLLFLLISNLGYSQNNVSPITVNVYYITDNLINAHGGIKTGFNYLGYANININFSTQNAKLWNGGELLIHPASTHGGEPTENLIGDYQGVTNIEAGNHIYMHELWFKQTFQDINFIIGLQDLNSNFANSNIGRNFINSSFGIHSIFSENLSVPIFPLTALGFTSILNISKKLVFKSSVFDGNPTNFENNPYNIKWQLDKENGILTIHEVQFSNNFLEKYSGNYKLGVFLHTKNINKNALKVVNGDTTLIKHSDYGLYINADQVIYKSHEKEIGVFLQLGFCPEKLNHNSRYFGIGFNYQGILKNANNVAGVALARSKLISNIIIHETAIELSYKTLFLKNVFVQPDIQYIIHPSGTNSLLKNALILNLRIIWEANLL